MEKPSRFWRIAAIIFVGLNAGGAVLAFAMNEQMHADTHLVLLGVSLVAYLFMRGAQSRPKANPLEEVEDPRIQYLQQSVDAMALEIERLSEAQRYNERLKVEQKPSEARPPKETP
jgi:hypothetical protein